MKTAFGDEAVKPEAGSNDPGKAKSLSNRIAGLLRAIQLACWPRHCFVCGEASGAEAVCDCCAPALPWLENISLCPVCSLPSPQGGICGACLRHPPRFDATLALFSYASPVREMVLALKHGQGFGLSHWLGSLLAEKQAQAGLSADLILPMPLHRARLCRRGFNQAVELARPIHAASRLAIARELVLRDVDTPCLEGLRRKERRQAVRGAFRCVEDLTSRHVLVVDDVMTSGATLDELAKTLKQRGAARVTNLVLARTLRRLP